MIYPRFMADSFWNFSEACELVGARYPAIPLGLITVAAMLPKSWNVRLVNRNTEELAESDLAWADMVMTGGMLFQQSDSLDLIAMCRARGLPVVVGGPDVSSSPHRYADSQFPGRRRGRGHHRQVHRRLGGRPTRGHFRVAEVPGRRHQDAGSALRSAEIRPISLHRRAIFARLSVHLRVLRHHRALWPFAAHQNRTIRCWTSWRRFTSSVIAATSISSTTISSATRRRSRRSCRCSRPGSKQHDYPFEFTTEASLNLADDARIVADA